MAEERSEKRKYDLIEHSILDIALSRLRGCNRLDIRASKPTIAALEW